MNPLDFKPMLASPADLDAIRYPIYASPKLDGIRCSIVSGKALTRKLKEIPSRHVFNTLSQPRFESLDGELIVGHPTNPTCYRDTVSHVMANSKVFPFAYYIFDFWSHLGPFSARVEKLRDAADELNGDDSDEGMRLHFIRHELLPDRASLEAYEIEQIDLGYEGIMLADPDGTYKFGRATTKGGELLKVKRFVDSEALVIGIEEEMFNGNKAEKNELGRTKRSTAKAGLVGKGTMGALIVRDLVSGVEFNIGTGFTAADRARTDWVRRIVKYKSFPIGVKDKPRHPVFLGFRPAGA